MERNLDITFFSRKFSKIAVFDYDYIIIIYNINNKSARFWYQISPKLYK